jgi:hypothetical protein
MYGPLVYASQIRECCSKGMPSLSRLCLSERLLSEDKMDKGTAVSQSFQGAARDVKGPGISKCRRLRQRTTKENIKGSASRATRKTYEDL